MKEMFSFSSEIIFKSMIGELTDISLEDDVVFVNDRKIKGTFIVDGKYKMTEASQVEETFYQEIPIEVDLDEKYDCSGAKINVSDFYYEIINEEILKVHIDMTIDELVVKKEPIVELLTEDDVKVIETLEEEKLVETREVVEIDSIFNELNNADETYSTYSVYIIRENDNVETVLSKYNITREELACYNDLEDIKLGSKLIIPSMKNG